MITTDAVSTEEAWALLTDPTDAEASVGGVNWWSFGDEDSTHTLVAATDDWRKAAASLPEVERVLGMRLTVEPRHVRPVQVLRDEEQGWLCRTERRSEIDGSRCTIVPVRDDAPGAVRVVVLDVA